MSDGTVSNAVLVSKSTRSRGRPEKRMYHNFNTKQVRWVIQEHEVKRVPRKEGLHPFGTIKILSETSKFKIVLKEE